MLLMNTKESTDMPFFGTVYATGNALLAGNAIQGLDVNLAIAIEKARYGDSGGARGAAFLNLID